MKLTVDLINDSITHINPLKDRELMLRNLKIPAIENLGGTKDLNDTIDFTNNDLRVLGNFPRLLRLKHLLLANNRISKIDDGLETTLPQLNTIILTNNSLEELGDIEPLTSISTLHHLVLLDNPVTKKEHYRLYVIYKMPFLRVLDYNKIKQKERDQAQALFQSKDGQDNALVQSMTENKSKTFEPGEGVVPNA
ncbi:leucine-rich repeat-domain-containing protein [Chlamydoabsidia padenii]|nr:leucine-rich repeat-domain-containing protein [Chlamydoabsidia padenii]